MPKFTRDSINANQDYLKSWDEYQLDFLNSENFCTHEPNKNAILFPIFFDIDDGIVKRARITAPQVKTLRKAAGNLVGDDAARAFDSYQEFFGAIDEQQSATPATPLDFDINSRVYMLFHIPRKNWTFTDHTQFSVDNISKRDFPDAFEVLGTFDDGHGLLVHNKNWVPATAPGEHNAKIKSFTAKYNLHVSIHQEQDGQDMCTDIIIDPRGNSNEKP